MDSHSNSIHQLFYQCEVDVSLRIQENKNWQHMPNPAALTARSTDIKSSSSEVSEPVATDLFFWNKNIITKFLPDPSEMLKLEGTIGCIVIHLKFHGQGSIVYCSLCLFSKEIISNTSLIFFFRLIEQGKEHM